jgi:hypothetical protein
MSTLNTPAEADASLKTAAGYSKSADILMKHIGKTRSADVVASMIVLRSLALEIYLKRLYAIEHNKSYEGHHLKQIFDALNQETRQKITQYYDRSLAESGFIKQVFQKHQEIKGDAPKLDLEHVLQQWSDATADWRYFFEPKNKAVFLAFGEIEQALSERLREVSPSKNSDPDAEQTSAA